MAKKRFRVAGGESIGGYFRKLYAEHPEWLRKRKNDPLYQRWLEDHPGYTEIPAQVKTNLANVKSVLKKKRKRGRRSQVEALGDGTRPAVRIPPRELAALEEQIDEGLSMAKNLDRAGLSKVIALLREARNQVVMRLHR
jgi:hypothetical protein